MPIKAFWTAINKGLAGVGLESHPAAQGNHWAMLRMGDIYRNGDGVERDLTKAASWYDQSARQGNKQAQRHLVEIGISAAL